MAITPKTTSEILYRPINNKIAVALDPYLFKKSKIGFAYALDAEFLLTNFTLINKNIMKENTDRQAIILMNSFKKFINGSLPLKRSLK